MKKVFNLHFSTWKYERKEYNAFYAVAVHPPPPPLQQAEEVKGVGPK
jgi:hypothetical protein